MHAMRWLEEEIERPEKLCQLVQSGMKIGYYSRELSPIGSEKERSSSRVCHIGITRILLSLIAHPRVASSKQKKNCLEGGKVSKAKLKIHSASTD